MKVLVDATGVSPQQGGIWTYTAHLLPLLSRRPGVEIVVLSSHPESVAALGLEVIAVSPRWVRSPYMRLIWRETRLPRLLKSAKADVLVGIAHEIPLRRLSAPSVLVVHDVGAIIAPALYGRLKYLRFVIAMPRMARRAAMTICVSETTKFDLVRTTAVDPARVAVVGEGPTVLPVECVPDIEDPYVLFAGSSLPHKNLATLVEAFRGSDPPPFRLILVGPPIGRSRGGAALPSGVEHRGFVADEELRELYSHAAGVMLPSLYEGFGLPALDAMTLGVPVVASNIGAVREVVGEAGLIVDDPLDPAAWATAIKKLQDAGLRSDLIVCGRQRAERFNWVDAADSFAQILVDINRAPHTR